MGNVTALMMDVITEKSGHTMTGLAVSVCLTPAAPSPLPLPYPTIATVSEGVIDECMRTKIDGAKVLTVGSCTKNCHGNEPGTLKEVVSLNTAGPSFPILGAPIVFIELGMAGITLSPGFMNKNPVPGGGSSASGAGGGGGGGGGAGGGAGGPPGSSTQGPSNGGGGGGGSNSGAAPPNAPAAPGAEGQAAGGHPVDVATGTLFTPPALDFMLPGRLHVQWNRTYRTSNVEHRCGLGWGWSHSLHFVAQRRGDMLALVDDELRETKIPFPGDDEVVPLSFGKNVFKHGEGIGVDLADGLLRVLLPDEEHRRYELRELRDGSGNIATIEWEGGEVVAIVDSCGRRATLSRDGGTLRWSLAVTDAEGQEHRRHLVGYEIDPRGDLVGVIGANGAEWRFEYDADHYLVREIQPDGVEYVFRHEVVGGRKLCVETWGEMSGRDILAAIGAPSPATGLPPGQSPGAPRGIFHTRLEYGPEPFTTRMTDGCGNQHRYRTNAHGLVDVYTDPRGYTRRYAYDEQAHMVTATDGAGRTERRRYDLLGRLLGVLQKDGTQVRVTYDDVERQATVLYEGGGREVQRAKDPSVIEQIDEGGRKTVFAMGERGLLKEVVRPNGIVEKLEYDAHGNVARHDNGLGVVYEYQWDLFGHVTRLKSEAGLDYELKLDSRGDIVEIVEPFGKRTQIATDVMGRTVEELSTTGGRTTSRYAAGRLIERVLPDGTRFRFGYDALLRLRWIENPAGERYERSYDPAGNVERETTFAQVTTEYEHDGANQVVGVRKGGYHVRVVRDGAGRIVQKEHSTGRIDRFRYDARGGMSFADSGGVAVTYERDAEGRVLREVQEATGWRFAVDYRYDALGRIMGRKYSTGWGVAVARRPETGRITRLATFEGELGHRDRLAVELDERGRERARRRLDGACSATVEREVYGLPSRVVVRGEADAEVHSRSFEWSPQGPTTAVVDSARGRRTYELDVMARPVRAQGLGADERFTYAPQGTALSEHEPGWAVARDGRPMSTARAHLHWDERGRLAGRSSADPSESWRFTYDENDQLSSAVRGDGVRLTYLYDPLGRRVAVGFGDGSSVWFGWDGNAIVEERSARSAVATRRVFDDDGYTPLLETDQRADWRMVLTDAAATPWAYVSPDARVSTVDLTTWGELADQSGEGSRLRFAGQRADELTGLHYNRHRYYAPDLHVFLTPDPLGMLSTMQDVGYVKNPTIFIDPLGLVTIVNGDPGDPVMSESVRQLQQQYPGARVINSDRLGQSPSLWQRIRGQNNMIDPNEDRVIVTTHGAPGTVNWRGAPNGQATGDQVGAQLNAAGFNPPDAHGNRRPGARVDLLACNGATPGQNNAPSVAEGIATSTQATTWGARANTPGDPYQSPPVWQGNFIQPRPWYNFWSPSAGNVEGRDYIPGRAGVIHAGEMSGTPNNPTVHGGSYVPTAPGPARPPPGPPGDQAWWGSE